MPSHSESSAQLFASFAAGSQSAADRMFHRYINRLSRLAQARLTPRLAQRVDAEDIVMSAWRSFFVAAENGRFSIRESGDLWSLLATITLRKVYRTAEFHSAEKRDVNTEVCGTAEADLIAMLPSIEPGPEEAAALVDLVENMLTSLTQTDRRIVELRLQGELMADVARESGVSERTVRRVLQKVRHELAEQNNLDSSLTKSASTSDRSSASGMALPAATESEKPKTIPDAISLECDLAYDKIVLERLIGSGGMGKVYKARLKNCARSVAVKFLHRRFQEVESAVARFIHEATVLRDLSHPGIVSVEGAGRTPSGICFLAMKFIEGNDAQSASSDLSVLQKLQIMSAVAKAVQHAHSVDIIHCDLKPSNIMLTRDCVPILTDFGLARRLDDRRSGIRSVAGTAPWMAPEQIDSHFGPIDRQTDVYGLAATLYTLLSGRPPYSGHRTADVLADVLSEKQAPDLNSVQERISKRLTQFCAACLSVSPADRPESAAIFADFVDVELAKLLENSEQTAKNT